MSYVCTKALRISGVDYAPGDAIPDGAIRPERVRALKTSGFIGELTEEVAPPADKKPEEKVVIEQVTIPVKAEDGREMEVSLVLSGVVKVFEVMQMPEEDAVKEIAGIEDENILITIHATESREAVKAAAKSRAVELSTGGEKKVATGGKKPTKGSAKDTDKDTEKK